MLRLALVAAVMVALLAALACSGGGDDEVQRVPVRHLDFSGAELTVADFFDPPFANEYPEVVAKVNGEPITGEALASRQVMLERSRRQLRMDLTGAALPELASSQLEEIESIDPLEALIEAELMRQAVERLDLLPSHEEAVQFTREQEESFLHPKGTASPENRRQTLEALRLQDWPAENWASDERVVEGYRRSMGIGRLRGQECDDVGGSKEPTPSVFVAHVGKDCSEFLKKERTRADIIYFVQWAD